MSFRNILLGTLVSTLTCLSSLHADDVGVDIVASTYDFESEPDDPFTIRDMGDKIGFIQSTENVFEYWGYESFDFGEGATHFTVRASSATAGGTLYVRLASFYNPTTTIATVDIPNTGGWNEFQDFTVEIDQDVLEDLGPGWSMYFVVENEADKQNYLFDVESFRFDNLTEGDPCDTPVNAANYSIESYPSDDFIIRDMGTKVGYIDNGSWLQYRDVNVGDTPGSISVRASSGRNGGTVYVTSDAPYGFNAANLIATVDVTNTGGWNEFVDFTANIELPISGIVPTLYLTFEGSNGYICDLESFTFCQGTVSDIGVDIDATTYSFESEPDDDTIIADLGDRVGMVAANGSFEYWGYEGFDFGDGATTFTVRAASGSEGGTLYARLLNHYSPDLTVAIVDIPNTGGWDSFQDFTVTVDSDVIEAFNGTNLFFVVTDDVSGNQFEIRSFRFDNEEL